MRTIGTHALLKNTPSTHAKGARSVKETPPAPRHCGDCPECCAANVPRHECRYMTTVKGVHLVVDGNETCSVSSTSASRLGDVRMHRLSQNKCKMCMCEDRVSVLVRKTSPHPVLERVLSGSMGVEDDDFDDVERVGQGRQNSESAGRQAADTPALDDGGLAPTMPASTSDVTGGGGGGVGLCSCGFFFSSPAGKQCDGGGVCSGLELGRGRVRYDGAASECFLRCTDAGQACVASVRLKACAHVRARRNADGRRDRRRLRGM